MAHKCGLIFSAEQQRMAHAMGLQSDREIVNSMLTGWRDGQPTMTTFDAAKSWLENQAEICDKLRDAGNLPPLEDIAFHYGSELSSMRDNLQRRNDCTAFATAMVASARILYQKWFGAELHIARFNPTGIYVMSSPSKLNEGYRAPDNGRTIDAVCTASNDYGMFTTDSIGSYTGDTIYSKQIIDAQQTAKGYQCGWVFPRESEPMEFLLLCLRACCPVITGNTIAVKSATHVDTNGVRIASVSGTGWGGGHAQAWIDYQHVNGTRYGMDCNSWGSDYFDTGKPYAWVSESGIKTFFSGTYNDLAACFAAESADEINTDLASNGGVK